MDSNVEDVENAPESENVKRTQTRSSLAGGLQSPPLWPSGHSWLSGWQLSFELVQALSRAEQLTQELDRLLQSEPSGNAKRRSELGSGLARSLAVVAAYSELLISEGGRSHHDD